MKFGGTSGALALALLAAAPAGAQTVPDDPAFPIEPSSARAQSQDEGLRDVGRTADTGIGEVGRRQTAIDGVTSVEIAGRLRNRLPNRVENRIRTRSDRNYDPSANATSPFEVADEESRRAGNPR